MTLATELHEASKLLTEVLAALKDGAVQHYLPMDNRRIGPYVYDAEERSRDVGLMFSSMKANYTVSPWMEEHMG